MLGILKKVDRKNKHQVANEILEKAATDFFNHPEVQEILRSNPESEKILDNVLKDQAPTRKEWMTAGT